MYLFFSRISDVSIERFVESRIIISQTNFNKGLSVSQVISKNSGISLACAKFIMREILLRVPSCYVALGGLMVSVLATGPKVLGFKPGPRTMDFKGDKIRSTPS
jgi:hypothetical protein